MILQSVAKLTLASKYHQNFLKVVLSGTFILSLNKCVAVAFSWGICWIFGCLHCSVYNCMQLK